MSVVESPAFHERTQIADSFGEFRTQCPTASYFIQHSAAAP